MQSLMREVRSSASMSLWINFHYNLSPNSLQGWAWERFFVYTHPHVRALEVCFDNGKNAIAFVSSAHTELGSGAFFLQVYQLV